MRRPICILIWTAVFVIFMYLLLAVPFAFFLLHKYPDPPTEILFVAIMILCPVAGLTGFILGLLGKLPGTRPGANKN